KRKEISQAQIERVTKLYVNAVTVAADRGHPDHGRVKIVGSHDFGYQRITVERPLRLRFEVTDDTLAVLAAAKPLARWDGRDALTGALRVLAGSVWWSRKEAS